MARFFAFLFISFVTAMLLAMGCSTMSRTEKQLARVDSFDSPDIPSLGSLPPERPSRIGLVYSRNVLVISYDVEVGKDPLKKAIRKYGAEIIYDYRIVNAIAVRIPDSKRLEDAVTHFEKVKGVLQVSRDQVHHLDGTPTLNLL